MVHPRVRGTTGNTATASARILVRPVHPRLCGEHQPLVQSGARPTVHPRLCGEHFDLGCTCAGNTSAGSSPPVRGTLDTLHPRLCGEHCVVTAPRCHPACAGNTSPVHPRLCGEHTVTFACAGNTVSTAKASPTRFVELSASVHPRLCGEHPRRGQQRHPRLCRGPPVHPRLCGEHQAHGSSPPVRGTQAGSRFIPACAGNT